MKDELTEAERLYGDIIRLSRPDSEESRRKHPRMSLQMRAKHFHPFAALRGYEEAIDAEGMKQYRVRREELFEDEAGILSDRLSKIRKGQDLTLVYFRPDPSEMAEPGEASIGDYLELHGTVVAVDFTFRTVKIGTMTLSMDDVVNVIWDDDNES